MTTISATQQEPPFVTPAIGTRTLAIDIGGTGLKALILGADGSPITERARVATPRPATPAAVLHALWLLIDVLGDYERVSVGFPGMVEDGVVKSAPNLHDEWKEFDLQRVLSEDLRRPVRVINDAAVQGYGVIQSKGLEIVLTLGTGLGCAVYVDGHYLPNLEIGHRPFTKNKTYEQYVGRKALKKVGKKKWNKRVREVLEQALTWNPRRVYLGGGNAKHLRFEPPPNVEITSNLAGLLGGVALWHDQGITAH